MNFFWIFEHMLWKQDSERKVNTLTETRSCISNTSPWSELFLSKKILDKYIVQMDINGAEISQLTCKSILLCLNIFLHKLQWIHELTWFNKTNSSLNFWKNNMLYSSCEGQTTKLILVDKVFCSDWLERKWIHHQKVWAGCNQKFIRSRLPDFPP